MNAAQFWALIHGERLRVAQMLEDLGPAQWGHPTLCAKWSVEDVTAHLCAVASTGQWAWIRSIIRAGFKPDQHNARLLAKYRGSTPDQTLANFQATITHTIAPSKDYAAFLGEVIVHGQDIAQPLGVQLTPGAQGLLEVAQFFISKDFAVNSRSLVKGLKLQASDAAFQAGDGPLIRGQLLDLVMVMAGRPIYWAKLTGDGVGVLQHRLKVE